MDRKELYQEVNNFNLQEKIKTKYGKNYTRCSNAELQKVVDEHKSKFLKKEVKSKTNTPKTEASKSNRLDKLIEVLYNKRILLKSEVNLLFNC